MGRHRVRTSLLTPTMLRMMRQVKDPAGRFGLELRSVMSGGEAVGVELHEWAAESLRIPINEVFGQTECNMVTGCCARDHAGQIRLDRPRGAWPCRGYRRRRRAAPCRRGRKATSPSRAPIPVMMLRYWNNPEATRTKYADGWLITGDLGHCDEDGYLWFHGRSDDVITSSGYRIGPTEIEDALARHSAVLLSAVVGVPDPVRTEAIKAFVVLRNGVAPEPELVDNIRDFVRQHLAKHEVPREIEFVASLPMTTTGKLLRRVLRDAERAKAATPRREST